MSLSTVIRLKLLSTLRASNPCRMRRRQAGVGEHEAKQRRHVGRDHSRPLGDAIDGNADTVDGGACTASLGEGVGRHDGLRGRLPSVLRCAPCLSAGSAPSIGATSSGSPMTPVEATKTSEARHLRTRATPPASARTLADSAAGR